MAPCYIISGDYIVFTALMLVALILFTVLFSEPGKLKPPFDRGEPFRPYRPGDTVWVGFPANNPTDFYYPGRPGTSVIPTQLPGFPGVILYIPKPANPQPGGETKPGEGDKPPKPQAPPKGQEPPNIPGVT